MKERWWRIRYAFAWWLRWNRHGVWLSPAACIEAAWAGDYHAGESPGDCVDEELSYWTE